MTFPIESITTKRSSECLTRLGVCQTFFLNLSRRLSRVVTSMIKSGTSTRPNPTHGSGWIVQVLPTRENASDDVIIILLPPFPRAARKEESNNVIGAASRRRQDLNDPPTTVGGDSLAYLVPDSITPSCNNRRRPCLTKML